MIFDATGREALLGGQLKLRERDPVLRQAAMFSHYRGARMGLGKDGGDILVVGGPAGWYWMIPLDAETTSVGVVFPGGVMAERRGRPLEALYEELLAASPRWRVASPKPSASRPCTRSPTSPTGCAASPATAG